MDIEYKDEVTNKIITDGRITDLAEKKSITDSITTLDNKTDDFRTHYDNFSNQACKLSEIECNETFSGCM